ncbi:uncharacterized protein LOC141596581 [Silene latifolia]|uniref:uncharacterized protein LOC141596581 n=1 Tax=Silene latifolia TaxID=37657 RepID=UPI003D774BA1
MEPPPDWDLLAVVRSCSSTTSTTTTVSPSHDLYFSPPPPQPPTTLPQHDQLCFSPTPSTACSSSSVLFGFSTPLPTTSFLNQEQQDIYTTTTNNNNNNNSSCSFQSPSCSSMNTPISSWSSSILVAQQQHQQQRQQQLRSVVKPSQVIFGTSSPTITTTTTASTSGATSQNHKTRKRKSLMKKVCHVPAEGLSSDMWAWRKYGQKPIKGSPHPRGYYRCSSSKGCLARKQVERNRSNPKMLIVTYTSEHNHPIPTHRNSLAGSTRHKPVTTTCSAPTTTSIEKTKTEGEILVKDEEDNDIGGLCDLILNDDFYVGFEKIDGGSDDSDCFSEQFSPSSEFSWLGNDGGGTTTTTTAASGS